VHLKIRSGESDNLSFYNRPLSDLPPQTKRVLAAKAEVDAAWAALAPAAASGSAEEVASARAKYEAAKEALESAMIDASRRTRTARGTSRRDASYTPEQDAVRAQIFEKLGLDTSSVETPSVGEISRVTIGMKPWTAEVVAKWAEACGTLGNSTIARWLLIGALLQLGPPPGWEGEWPPKSDDE
jgi:hypothetical protein